MTTLLSLLTPVLAMTVPLLLLVIGLVPAKTANANPRLMASISIGGAWLAFICALMVAVLHSFDSSRSWTLFSMTLPGDIGAFSIGTYINSVTVMMLILVSFVGAVVSRYARNYLDGDPNQGGFYKWLSLTLASILTLIISGNLLMFSLAWIATSLCLHQLLMFYPQRPAAALAAHKKFIASRIGDVSLLIAIFLIGSSLNTLEFDAIYSIMAAMEEPLPAGLQWAAWLIVISAAMKSAQFPFHGWLIQVMEAPTPVSALLHAGIVNAGAFLIIRMSPIMSLSGTAMDALALIGLTTLGLASMVMLTQTSIKVSLAWSTTAQMGFMLLECGLGLYSLAMLHLIAHSLYKAHAFLASGSGVDSYRAPEISYSASRVRPLHWILIFGAAGLMSVGVGAAFGITLQQQPALVATGIIVAIAISQLLLQAVHLMANTGFMLRALGLGAVVSIAYYILHAVFEHALSGSVPPLRDTGGLLQYTLIVLTIILFPGLLILQQAFKKPGSPLRDRIYVHLYNGLYIDVFITRVLQRVWPAPKLAETNGA